MGLKSFLFGSSAPQILDKPEFGNFSEYMNALSRGGLYYQENPEVIRQYFSSPAGQTELKKLGYTNVDDFMSDAASYAPNVATSKDYGSIADSYSGLGSQYGNTFDQILGNLQGINGDLTDYGKDFTYSNQDISNIPDEVYKAYQDMEEEQAARGYRGALKSLGAQYGARGFKPGSGFEQASGNSLGRNYLEQLSNIGRDIGMQKAQSKLDLSKFMSAQDLQRQQLQDASNMGRASYLTDLQKYAKNFGLSKAQSQSDIASRGYSARSDALTNRQNALANKTNSAMLPYNTAYQYWDRVAMNSNPTQGKSGQLGNIVNTGTKIAGMFL